MKVTVVAAADHELHFLSVGEDEVRVWRSQYEKWTGVGLVFHRRQQDVIWKICSGNIIPLSPDGETLFMMFQTTIPDVVAALTQQGAVVTFAYS